MNRLELIREYIDLNQLNFKSRKRSVIYKRYYLYNELRQYGMTFMDIGLMFDRDHSTIQHGVRVHNDMLSYKDPNYIFETKPVADYLGESKFLEEMKLYKRQKTYDRIKFGYYENSFQQIEQEA